MMNTLLARWSTFWASVCAWPYKIFFACWLGRGGTKKKDFREVSLL